MFALPKRCTTAGVCSTKNWGLCCKHFAAHLIKGQYQTIFGCCKKTPRCYWQSCKALAAHLSVSNLFHTLEPRPERLSPECWRFRKRLWLLLDMNSTARRHSPN